MSLYVKCEVTSTALHMYLLLTSQSLQLALVVETCQYPTCQSTYACNLTPGHGSG